MFHIDKRFTTRFFSLLLVALGLLTIQSPESACGFTQPALVGDRAPGVADNGVIPSTTVSVDEDGYTLWTVDWSSISWCVPVSTLRYPIDLGTVDPTALSDASLVITFNEGIYDPDIIDPSWSVGFNGNPPGDWSIVGDITGQPSHGKIWNTAIIPIDPILVIDGENNLWLQQHDNCPQELDCFTCACTCIEISRVILRASAKLLVRSVTPAEGTKNVAVDQRNGSEIHARFSIQPDPESVNADTFTLYYYDDQLNKVFVEGQPRRISETDYAFIPRQALRDGIRYFAQVWGEADALAANREKWVTDLGGFPMEEGKLWSFWTLPKLAVDVIPIQVLETDYLSPLIANKPTMLKVFIRWDKKEDVYHLHQTRDVEVEDIILSWSVAGGSQIGASSWKDGDYSWKPDRAPDTAIRKREYRVFTTAEESYDKYEKLASRDSINYFGFIPSEAGSYTISVQVELKDSKGLLQPFRNSVTRNVNAVNQYELYMKLVGAGADYGKSGISDVSIVVNNHVKAMRAIYPVPSVRRPASAGAMSYYKPTTSLWLFDWADEPAWKFPKKYLLQEMSELCMRTTGCRAMVGIVRDDWLVDLGLSLRESAPRGALITSNTSEYYRFVTAHEIGHLAGFEHTTESGADGYDVSTRRDLRQTVSQMAPRNSRTLSNIFDFMNIDPSESPPPDRLWISNRHYVSLGLWTGAWRSPGPAQIMRSSSPLLLAAGGITLSTGDVELLPWYEMEPGDWIAPEPGPYELVFVDGAGQEILDYSQPFTVSTTLQPAAGSASSPEVEDPALFTLLIPYPPSAAKIQIWKNDNGGSELLHEVTREATAPDLTIDDPANAAWTGPQAISWQSAANPAYFAVDVSTDGGDTWEAMAINLTEKNYTVETAALPNTTEAHIRVSVTGGVRTTTQTAGPFTIDNPPAVSYVSPNPDAVGVGVDEIIVAGFRDEMDASTLDSSTVVISGGPYDTVAGVMYYDQEAKEVIFIPQASLAYSTTYTVRITTGVLDAAGDPLPSVVVWSFTTGLGNSPPRPVLYSPDDGELNVPVDAPVAVLWDRDLNPATIDASLFQMAKVDGEPVSAVISYDASSRQALLAPDSDLAPDTTYVVTLTAGIEDTSGVATPGDAVWSFTTGSDRGHHLGLTGAFADWGNDADRDGLYEELVILVGVSVAETGSYGIGGQLADLEGANIAWAGQRQTLDPGVHFLELVFDGASIGGRNVDGPYTLAELTFYLAPTEDALTLSNVIWETDAYRTFGYAAHQFAAPLRFSGLPDLHLMPGYTLIPAFNVRDYASHFLASSDQLVYSIASITDLDAGVTLANNGYLSVNPQAEWEGEMEVTIQAAYGGVTAQDTFRVSRGWPNQIYLPDILRNSSGSRSVAGRAPWMVPLEDDFEDTFLWQPYSSYSGIDRPVLFWGARDCASYSGEYSAWPFGMTWDEEGLECGANYPDNYWSSMCRQAPVNLTYTNKAEFRAKVWTDLAPGHELCLVVTDSIYNECYNATYYGVCRTGKTNGWEDMVLDLSNVPGMGNLLGREQVWVSIQFKAEGTGARPIGAYVDDVQVRLCPEGLTCQP
ncbi:MAG: Ig-like domain-containing protein [Anaerolineales bacterium]|nr:Ig-like domain-containing protein [Anaerolineales bacterium]